MKFFIFFHALSFVLWVAQAVPSGDTKKECVPNASWFDGCNHCHCSEHGFAACTLKSCDSTVLQIVEKISTDVSPPQDSTKKCTPLTSWQEDCNTCFCSSTGIAGCTRMTCDKMNLPVVDQSTKKCVPGTHWKEDCNSCFCGPTGVAGCTLMACNPPVFMPVPEPSKHK